MLTRLACALTQRVALTKQALVQREDDSFECYFLCVPDNYRDCSENTFLTHNKKLIYIRIKNYMVILRLDRRIHETIFDPAITSQDDDWGFIQVQRYHFHAFWVMPSIMKTVIKL